MSNLSVLHIILDDARADIGAFDQTHVATPAIDTFAASALQFTNAYAQVALCCPSRGSFLSGRRPLFDQHAHTWPAAGAAARRTVRGSSTRAALVP